MSYYDREIARHIDGTPIFKSVDDEKSEAYVASVISNSLSCCIDSFGKLSPIDWYAHKNGRLIGLLELKSRSHDSLKYKTVYLNVRKYLALLLGSSGLGVPSVFVVDFTDYIKWINVTEIKTNKIIIGGCKKIVKSRNDIEPIIEVPVSDMKNLRGKSNGNGRDSQTSSG